MPNTVHSPKKHTVNSDDNKRPLEENSEDDTSYTKKHCSENDSIRI